MKSKFYSFTLLCFLLLTSVAAFAQKRDKVLNVEVKTNIGVSLAGQAIDIEQTDFEMQYPAATLDADGKCTINAYAGNHKLTVKRDGFNVATTTFRIEESETSKTVKLTLTEAVRDPFAVEATPGFDAYTGKSHVNLSWNVEKPAFFDDFESYSPFAVKFGDWTGIDGDEVQAAWLQGDYPNRGVMQYAQIINPLTVEPMWYNDYPVLRAYSGKQYVGFTRTHSGVANDDWLISPEITVGNENVVSFYAMAADKYEEKFIVYITEKTDNPTEDDFVKLTKGNVEQFSYKVGWQRMQYDLSKYAQKKVKIAIRYISEANNGGAFMLKVDDFFVGQLEKEEATKAAAKAMRLGGMHKSADNPNETFDIYLDNQKVATTSKFKYVLKDVAEGTHTIGIQANYIAAQSQMVNTTVEVSKANYASLTFNVETNSKLSADGTVIHVVADKDATTYDVTVANGVAKLAMLPKGKYYVTVDKGAFKAYSTTIDLNENVVSPIKLEDEVQTPYNITAEMENGAGGFDVSLKWNQLLGFSDSFETYDDFATGQFGDWKSVDLDQSAVYPIGLGSQSNIVKFPGSGTADAPTAIAPMVFNPWNTTPAMLPTDKAVEALDGDKFIAFFSPQQKQANKWLISPEIDIYDGFVLKVAAKSYASVYPESLEFAVSETCSTDPFDFKVLTEAPNISADAWLDYQTDLSAYAGKKVRIGVHYKTFDGFFAQLDNFRVEPEEGSGVQKDYGNVLNFNIYLDGKKVGESATPSFTIKNVSEGKHTVGIEAVYKNSVSKMATYELVATGIGSVKVDAANADVEIYNIAGQKLNTNFQSLPQGVYVVKDANGVRKVRK